MHPRVLGLFVVSRTKENAQEVSIASPLRSSSCLDSTYTVKPSTTIHLAVNSPCRSGENGEEWVDQAEPAFVVEE